MPVTASEAIENAARLEADGKLADARAALEAALTSFSDAGAVPQLLIERGRLAAAQLDYNVAAQSLERALEILGTTPDNAAARARALLERGLVSRYTGDLDTAVWFFHAAKDLAQDPSSDRARSLFLLGPVQSLRSDFQGARRLLHSAIDLARQVGDKRQEGHAHRELAAIARVELDIEGGRRHLNEAEQCYGPELSVGLANLHREAGALSAIVGDTRAARKALQQSISEYDALGRPLGAAASLRRLVRLGGQEQAVDAHTLQRVVDAARATHDDVSIAHAMVDVAAIEGRQGQADRAKQRLAEARELYVQLGNERGEIQVELEQGRIEAREGLVAASVARLTAAVKRAESLGFDAEGADLLLAKAQGLQTSDPTRALICVLRAVHMWERVGRALTSAEERASLYALHRDAYELGLHLAAELGDVTAGIFLMEAGRSEGLLAALTSRGQLPSALLKSVGELRRHTLEGARAGDEKIREDIERRVATLSRELERATSRFFRMAVLSSDPYTVDPADLPAKTHALIFYEGRDGRTYWRLWLGKGEAQLDEIHLTTAELAALSRNADSGRGARRACQVLARALLPTSIWRPSSRDNQGDALLAIAPAGRLDRFPLAGLRRGRTFLSDLYRVSIIPSLGYLTGVPAPAPSDGGPVGFFNASLPGVVGERQAFLTSFPHATLVANAEELVDALRYGSSGLCVIATHGTNASGLAQSLELGEGQRLAASEILTMNVPPVCVLGSCWSARMEAPIVGDALGILTAFLFAGARTVIGAQGPVSSRATAVVLSHFYARLARGDSVIQALRIAQRRYRRRHPFSSPDRWARLVAFGDDATLPPPRALLAEPA